MRCSLNSAAVFGIHFGVTLSDSAARIPSFCQVARCFSAFVRFDRCYCAVSGIIICVQGSELISITAFNLFFSSRVRFAHKSVSHLRKTYHGRQVELTDSSDTVLWWKKQHRLNRSHLAVNITHVNPVSGSIPRG